MQTTTGLNDTPTANLKSRSGESFIPDIAAIQKRFANLPVSTYEHGEMVIVDGQATGKLLLLKKRSG